MLFFFFFFCHHRLTRVRRKQKRPGKNTTGKTQQRERREREREQTTETLFPRVVEKDQNLDTHAKPTTTRLSLNFDPQIQIGHVQKITCSPAIFSESNTTVKMKEWVAGSIQRPTLLAPGFGEVD
jgi:hypothetical protein